MLCRHHKARVVLLILVGVCAAGIWTYRLMRTPGIGVDDLHDTAGVSARISRIHAVRHGLTADCVIVNRTDREAASVVYTVKILTEDGRVIASNPLGNVLTLKPGESRPARLFVPVENPLPAAYRSEVDVSLVRWEK